MLSLPEPPKTSFQFLKDLPVEESQPISPQMMNLQEIFIKVKSQKNYYYKDIFKQLKSIFSGQENHKYDEVEQILSPYFEFVLNPLYKNIENLPISLFVCGYCKETFFKGVEYLLHCFQLRCKINHIRSTYFVCFKDTQFLIKNRDLQEKISQNNITPQKFQFFGKPLHFAKFQLTKRDQEKITSEQTFKCGRCNIFWPKGKFHQFIKHCFGPCNSFQNEKTSHEFRILENMGLTDEFIKDIQNLCLNYNILALFHDSYIRIRPNFQFKITKSQKNLYFCSNCQAYFRNQSEFLKHCLFQCQKISNKFSSHVLQRKKCLEPTPKKQFQYSKKYIFITKLVLEEYKSQNNKNKRWRKIVTEANSRYEKIWKEHQNIYFCASCFSFYSELGVYLAHFTITGCTVNHTNNSHFLLNQKHERLKMCQLSNYEEEEDRNFVYQNFQSKDSLRLIYNFIELINHRTGKRFQQGNIIRCGKCKILKKFSKWGYLYHLIKQCKCPNHPENSFQIILRHQYINLHEIKNSLRDIQYCLQILRINPMTNLLIFENPEFKQRENLNLQNHFYCGKCQLLFENKYEFYLHYLIKCKALNSPYSSHFFRAPEKYKNKARNDGFQILRLNVNSLVYYDAIKRGLAQRHSIKNTINVQKKKESFSEKALQRVNEQNRNSEGQINEIQNLKQSHKKIGQNQNPFQGENFEYEEKNTQNNKDLGSDEYLDIYPNIEFNSNESKTKYYCGKCDLRFKKKQVFIDHIFVCMGQNHPKSSHFLLTLDQYRDINLNTVLNATNYSQNCQYSYPSYIEDQKNVVCGCGAKKIFGLNLHFSNIHTGIIPKGTSHFLIRLKILKKKDQVQIYLPIQPKPQHEKDEFICPCNPFKKLVYRDFASHIIKKHEGKSPIFFMKFNNPTGQKMQLN